MGFYIGVEKVKNGNFDYDINWNKNTGWTIGSGVATADGQNPGAHLYQDIQLNDLKTYAYSFDYVASANHGRLKMQWYQSGVYIDIVTLDAENGEIEGHVEGKFTVTTNTNGNIYFKMHQHTSTWQGYIWNVQVRELKLVMDNTKTSYFVNVAPAFKFRTIISYHYMVGGYKSSTPWKSAHKVVASTDQGTNLGDMLQYAASYVDGVGNNKTMFVFGTDGDGSTYQSGFPGTTTYTSSFNMYSDTTYTHLSTHDTANARNQGGTVWKEEYFAWIFGGYISQGGNGVVEKMDLTNEAMTSTVYTSLLSGDDDSQAACGKMVDEHFAYLYDDTNAVLFNMITESESSSTQWSPSGQQRGISSKNRKGWCGSEGSYAAGQYWNRWDLTTNTNLGTMTKINNTGTGPGEENYTMGQDHQYMLGNHDGAQNNESHKFYYATETGVANPSGLAPTAHDGQSSAACGWRS